MFLLKQEFWCSWRQTTWSEWYQTLKKRWHFTSLCSKRFHAHSDIGFIPANAVYRERALGWREHLGLLRCGVEGVTPLTEWLWGIQVAASCWWARLCWRAALSLLWPLDDFKRLLQITCQSTVAKWSNLAVSPHLLLFHELFLLGCGADWLQNQGWWAIFPKDL